MVNMYFDLEQFEDHLEQTGNNTGRGERSDRDIVSERKVEREETPREEERKATPVES